jgi:hypothetical protein
MVDRAVAGRHMEVLHTAAHRMVDQQAVGLAMAGLRMVVPHTVVHRMADQAMVAVRPTAVDQATVVRLMAVQALAEEPSRLTITTRQQTHRPTPTRSATATQIMSM